MTIAAPTAEIERLKPFEGKFRANVTVTMGPGDPQKSTGVMINTFQVDGLYLHQQYTGDQTDGPFPRFVGQGYWGFNGSSQLYEGFWIDNASRMMQLETGSVDSTGSVWTMYSEFLHPANGQLIKKRSVISLIDADHHRMESYMTGPDGHEAKVLAIEYARTQ